jgi:hypothetical protein
MHHGFELARTYRGWYEGYKVCIYDSMEIDLGFLAWNWDWDRDWDWHGKEGRKEST